ncbi:hypothetical protein V8D89_012124 [Ganoderma adspersum]
MKPGASTAKKMGAEGYQEISVHGLELNSLPLLPLPSFHPAYEMLCYVPRILYIDVDCHHGDGVEEAFWVTDRVMTLSLHKFGKFFPGTGLLEDRGRGKGMRYAVNGPLKDGITDESSIFKPVFDKIIDVFRLSATVLQCGADSLSEHPMMILGGGGYTVKNVARAWTYKTVRALGIEQDIDTNLLWNEYFEEKCLWYLSELNPAPSVQMHDVPHEGLAEHLSLGGVRAHTPIDDLDERLAFLIELATEHARHVYDLQTQFDQMDSEAESTDDGLDGESSSHRRRRRSSRRLRSGRKQMSIVTSKCFDVPQLPPEFKREIALEHDEDDGCGHWHGHAWSGSGSGKKRRFFESRAA